MAKGSSEDKGQVVEQQFIQAMTEVHSVLPGVFGLFGFQLIGAFNDVFAKQLQPVEKWLYVAALVLLALSAALLMTPAAYHRKVRPHSISDSFANLISRLLAWGMLPIIGVFPIDGYLVTKVVSKSNGWAILVGGVLFSIFFWAWVGFPAIARHANRSRREKTRAAGGELEPA